MSAPSGHRGICRTARPPRPSGPDRLFVSYRKADTGGHSAHIFDLLCQRFGDDYVFFDTKFEGGEEFPVRIRDEVARTDVMLVVIGRQWVSIVGRDGEKRLFAPGDWVRQEIELARSRNCRLIPVLVQGAEMPWDDELPESIRWICHRQAVVLANVKEDFDRLAARLEKPSPRNRFAHRHELRTLAPFGSLVRNALLKPCSILFALCVAAIAFWTTPWLIALAIVSYVALTLISFFTLAEAEWVGSRTGPPSDRRAGDEPR